MTALLIMLPTTAVMLLIEKLWPANDLPKVNNWWARVALTNLCQLLIVLCIGYAIEPHLSSITPPWALSLHVNLAWQLGIGYLLTTFLYYFWHRLRHESRFFWKLCHQLHHSPERMEVLMSFYKHPVEITLNALISSTISYLILGCSIEAAGLITLATGIAELFYHWNIKTPVWLGPLFQRPESHRVHHQRYRHTNNYSDIPLWDMLFGTYKNPRKRVEHCGFQDQKEDRIDDILAFRDVLSKNSDKVSPLHLLPSCIGCSKRWACHASQTKQNTKP
ncbi:sterol desaturase family protein [Rubritalea marina]|uniref:sterol desaturase family protein n=1 Tax=Rubritalea marina TaxID=361055 RepID=UPI0003797268|nr:sterol desaturase family protein [Rubritalea marina]